MERGMKSDSLQSVLRVEKGKINHWLGDFFPKGCYDKGRKGAKEWTTKG